MIPQRVLDRFWSRVDRKGDEECWPWQMSTGNHGYGQIGWGGKNGRGTVLAHRVAYELTHGEIPTRMTVDHVCRNRPCCNPNHLRLLTNEENGRHNLYKVRTHCSAGHEYTEESVRLRASSRGYPHRRCLICAREYSQSRRDLKSVSTPCTKENDV